MIEGVLDTEGRNGETNGDGRERKETEKEKGRKKMRNWQWGGRRFERKERESINERCYLIHGLCSW